VKTFALNPILLESFRPIQEDGKRAYDGVELRTKTDLMLFKANFPIDVDINQNLCAFAYTEINEDSAMDSALR